MKIAATVAVVAALGMFGCAVDGPETTGSGTRVVSEYAQELTAETLVDIDGSSETILEDASGEELGRLVWSQAAGEGLLVIEGISENPLSKHTFDGGLDAEGRNDLLHDVYRYALVTPRAEGGEVPYMEAGGCQSCQNRATCCMCFCNEECGGWGSGCSALLCSAMCIGMGPSAE
jgi:hypothetical protein